jgi:hypothetical protein
MDCRAVADDLSEWPTFLNLTLEIGSFLFQFPQAVFCRQLLLHVSQDDAVAVLARQFETGDTAFGRKARSIGPNRVKPPWYPGRIFSRQIQPLRKVRQLLGARWAEECGQIPIHQGLPWHGKKRCRRRIGS